MSPFLEGHSHWLPRGYRCETRSLTERLGAKGKESTVHTVVLTHTDLPFYMSDHMDGSAAAPTRSTGISHGTPRSDMIASAVSFLEDPNVQSSPMSQRISFLESKGLSSQEIDIALGQVGRAAMGPMGQRHNAGAAHAMAPTYPMMPAYPPVRARRDWRDWFIMGVVSGTVGYGVIALARKYIYPHLQPPNQSVLEEEREALASKYDEVAVHLEELDQTTEAMSQGLATQRSAIEESVREVNEFVAESRAREEQRDKDLDQMKTDIESMREELAGMLDRSRKSSITALTDLQGELKSLRSLLVSRGGLSTPGAPSTGVSAQTPSATSGPSAAAGTATNGGSETSTSPSENQATSARPAPRIPAWQLAEPQDEDASSTAS